MEWKSLPGCNLELCLAASPGKASSVRPADLHTSPSTGKEETTHSAWIHLAAGHLESLTHLLIHFLRSQPAPLPIPLNTAWHQALSSPISSYRVLLDPSASSFCPSNPYAMLLPGQSSIMQIDLISPPSKSLSDSPLSTWRCPNSSAWHSRPFTILPDFPCL